LLDIRYFTFSEFEIHLRLKLINDNIENIKFIPFSHIDLSRINFTNFDKYIEKYENVATFLTLVKLVVTCDTSQKLLQLDKNSNFIKFCQSNLESMYGTNE
jgi:hypothetical protein